MSKASGPRGYAAIGLDHPKSAINVGHALRAADCYGAAFMATTGQRYTKAPTDVSKAHRRLPLFQVEDLRDIVPHGCVPVAVDLVPQARDLRAYTHPERAFYIFGAEDATLGDRILGWCRDVVYVPTNHCMNLAATVNVVLFDRLSKRAKPGEPRVFIQIPRMRASQ